MGLPRAWAFVPSSGPAWGRGQAILLTALLLACGPGRPPSEEERTFQEASRQINTYDGRQEAFGNSEEARALAARFSTMFRQLREIGFTGRQKGLLTQGHFLTYCRMDADRVCVLVHVPLLRKFTQEAQKTFGAQSEKSLHEFFGPAPSPSEEPRFRPITSQQALLKFVVRLRDGSTEERLAGLAGIRYLAAEAEAAVPDVARVLTSDDSPAVRIDAARTLGRIGTPAARTALEGARPQPDTAVGDAIRAALREIDSTP